MPSLPFDIYPLIRPFLFRMDAEDAHAFALSCLKKGWVAPARIEADPVLRTNVCGIDFAHPLGLAPGFDKHAEVIPHIFDLGFSFAELGGVTPLPQPGNPRPRLFRIPSAEAVINRFGFNSVGIDVFVRRLAAYRDSQVRAGRRIVGVNIAKNKETADAADDYAKGVIAFARYADFVTVNVSSPNTPGLRDMQERETLRELLHKVIEAREASGHDTLLFLKIAPDIDEAQSHDIAEVALASGIDAMIVGNTTTSRPGVGHSPLAREAGGLSGRPLFDKSTAVLARMRRLTEGRIPLIGAGGIFDGSDAYTKIRAGASLIQLYSAMVYQGPAVVGRVVSDLADLLKRDGFASVADAVGVDAGKL